MRVQLFVVAALGALALSGCGTDDDGAAGAPRVTVTEEGAEPDAQDVATEPVLRLVATVAPVADLVAQVGGDRVTVTSFVPPGADSHTYEPRPRDVAVLADADAYFGVGLDLNDAAIELAGQHLRDGAPVLLLGELALTDEQLVHDHAHGGDGHTHGGDGHTHGEDGHTHGDDHERFGPNPHVWTSLRNAAAMVEVIAEELSTLDPEGAELYASNGASYVDDLDRLDQAIGTATATVPEGNRTLVTYHDAWTYFARDHGFDFATAVQPGDFSEPSAADVRQVIDLIRDLDVPAVFGSEVFPSRVLDAIAAETEAVYVGDLSDDVLPGAPGDPEHSYLELMRRNAVTIVDALRGDSSALT